MALVKEFMIGDFRAVIVKHDSLGHLCGYIGLPEGHGLHGLDCDHDGIPGDVHGGWTYAEGHAPYEKPDGRWYLGFDCAHAGDLVPGTGAYTGDVYRDESFVENELRQAAPTLSHPVSEELKAGA